MKNSWYLNKEIHQFLSESLSRWLEDKNFTYSDISDLLLKQFGIDKSSESIRKISKKHFVNDVSNNTDEEINIEEEKILEEEFENENLISIENEYYNSETKEYFIPISKGKTIRIKRETLSQIKEAYSNDSGQSLTINEICRKFSIPRKYLTFILEVLGWSHSSVSPLDIDFEENSVEQLVETAIERKHHQYEIKLRQKDLEFYKKYYEKNKANEIRIDDFAKGFKEAISTFEYRQPQVTRTVKNPINNGDKVDLIVSASDFHIGFFQRASETLVGRAYNLGVIKEFIEEYVEGIYEFLDSYRVPIQTVRIFDLGDNFEGLRGETDRGTPRHISSSKRHIWHAGYQMMFGMVDALRGIAPSLSYSHVTGNHDEMADYLLVYTLRESFKNQKDVTINVNDKPVESMTIGNSQILLRHGRKIGDKISNAHEGRMKHDLLLLHDNQSKYRYFFCGDKHQMQENELGGFTFIRMPSALASDKYGESINVHSRQSGKIFILSHEQGITTSHNIFFENRGDKD